MGPCECRANLSLGPEPFPNPLATGPSGPGLLAGTRTGHGTQLSAASLQSTPRLVEALHGSRMQMNPTNPVIVQGDGKVLLETRHPRFDEARDFLARFAELESSPDLLHTYCNQPPP